MLAQQKRDLSRRDAAIVLGVSERTLRRHVQATRIREAGGRIASADLDAGRTGLRAPPRLQSALLHARLERTTAMVGVVVEVIDQQRVRLQREDVQWLVQQAGSLKSPARWLLLAVRLRHDDLAHLCSPEQMTPWFELLRCARTLRSEAAHMGGDIETLASIVHATVLRAVARAVEHYRGRRWIQQTIEQGGAGANRQLVRRERKRRSVAALARRG